ncbi:hypothetical protein P4O66_009474 [Electrophorus voltai]|uniref:O-acyltransferase n=1 Tax=Electrophorus voltai TaxID=2609070 RepID=A0AAD9DV14_9TELE|nr:hypothetical protein P4O66_009474 [Electrophorus voltai]
MATNSTNSNVVHRSNVQGFHSNPSPRENGSVRQDANHIEEAQQLARHVERMKAEVTEQVMAQMSEVLEKAFTDSLQSLSQSIYSGTDPTHSHANANVRRHRMEDGKVFVARQSILDELFEISHIRTIYHMFIAALFLFIISTLTVDYIDQGRLVLEFDLFFYAFGQLGTVIWAWTIMFVYTLLVLYYILSQWGHLYHYSQWKMTVSVTSAVALLMAQIGMLGYFPVHVVLLYQLPPASCIIVILEQIFGCLFYLYFILVRLCIPVFMNDKNLPFSTRTLVLAMFHSTLPGMLMLLLVFFAFLHCWLNAFAEIMRFADRMFYKDWWNSTSFANYYRTWNIVVHDWLYYYAYRDFLWLSGHRFRSVATLSVFAVSAFVHEYAITMSFGFFYPVMFCLFAVIGVVFNFTLNDKLQSPVWNIIMWICLFIGQGVQVCLYCLEWYAQVHCPRTGVRFLNHHAAILLLSLPFTACFRVCTALIRSWLISTSKRWVMGQFRLAGFLPDLLEKIPNGQLHVAHLPLAHLMNAFELVEQNGKRVLLAFCISIFLEHQ